MEDPIVRIAAVIIGLALLFYILRAVCIWISDLLRQLIPVTYKLFIVIGVLILVLFWFYPEKIQYLIERLIDAVKNVYYHNF